MEVAKEKGSKVKQGNGRGEDKKTWASTEAVAE